MKTRNKRLHVALIHMPTNRKGSASLLANKGTSKYRYDFERFFHENMGFKILADEAQYKYVEAILAPNKKVQAVVSDSAAGTGKSALALAAAYYQLSKGKISKIIYVRNTVSVRENGFLPGTIEDKEAAYMKPAYDVIQRIGNKMDNQDLFADLIRNEQLVCTSTSFLRGVDYDMDAVLIIDEAQNLDLTELQTVLTRPHDNVKVVMVGSSRQNDNTKVRKYGPAKLLPFEVYIKHLTEQNEIPVENIHLETNYRGRFANFADQIQDTVKRINLEPEAAQQPAAKSAFALTNENATLGGMYGKDSWGIHPDGQSTMEGVPASSIETIPFYGLDSFQ